MSDKLKAVRLGQEYFKETLYLFNNVFTRSESIDFWTDKHIKNPFGNSEFFGVFDQDRLVGMSGFMPIEYINGDTAYRALITCESAVDASFRGRGLYTDILSTAEEWAANNGYAFLMAFPNPCSYPGFKKQGFVTTGQADSWGRILNFPHWLTHMDFKRPLANLYLIKGYIGNLTYVIDTSQYTVSEVQVSDFLHFHNSLQSFKCNYTEEYIRWKLKEDGYIYRIDKCNELSAYVIILHNKIEYLRVSESSDCSWLKSLFDEITVTNGLAELCIDDRLLPKSRIIDSGFVTRRDTPHYRVAKGLNDLTRSKQFYNGLIFQNIEED